MTVVNFYLNDEVENIHAHYDELSDRLIADSQAYIIADPKRINDFEDRILDNVRETLSTNDEVGTQSKLPLNPGEKQQMLNLFKSLNENGVDVRSDVSNEELNNLANNTGLDLEMLTQAAENARSN